MLTAAVFLPLWYTAGSLCDEVADYPRRGRSTLSGVLLVVPVAAVAGLWWAVRAWHPGSVDLAGVRTPLFLLAGAALVSCCTLLATAVDGSSQRLSAASAFFAPLWLGVCLVNAFLGVRVGYAVAEEAAISAAHLLPPVGLSVLLAWHSAARERADRSPCAPVRPAPRQ